jgi:hypothetical protein
VLLITAFVVAVAELYYDADELMRCITPETYSHCKPLESKDFHIIVAIAGNFSDGLSRRERDIKFKIFLLKILRTAGTNPMRYCIFCIERTGDSLSVQQTNFVTAYTDLQQVGSCQLLHYPILL